VVLLVDDDEMERFLIRQALEPAGFEIVEAEDGVTALEALAITKPDVVVLDVVMPGRMALPSAKLLERCRPAATRLS